MVSAWEAGRVGGQSSDQHGQLRSFSDRAVGAVRRTGTTLYSMELRVGDLSVLFSKSAVRVSWPIAASRVTLSLRDAACPRRAFVAAGGAANLLTPERRAANCDQHGPVIRIDELDAASLRILCPGSHPAPLGGTMLLKRLRLRPCGSSSFIRQRTTVGCILVSL
jgi:hypothetical protein